MRYNLSGNVHQECNLLGLMMEPQEACCTKFGSAHNGYSANPKTSAYNDALKCLTLVDCSCLENGANGCDIAYPLYEDLQNECMMHVEMEGCRSSCAAWVHDGREPIKDVVLDLDDCYCWDFKNETRSAIDNRPIWKANDAKCAEGNPNKWFQRYKNKDYDWWKCWYIHDCVDAATGSWYNPPIRNGIEMWDTECNAKEMASYLAQASNHECRVGGVPRVCDMSQSVDPETGIETPNGIFIDPLTFLTKDEPIDCTVDDFACLPTVSAGVRFGGSLAGVVLGVVSVMVVNTFEF